LSYSGTISFGSATLTTNATGSSLLDTDATNGLQLAIDKCSQAWTESGPPYTYTCGGSTSSVLASRALIGSSIALSNLTPPSGPRSISQSACLITSRLCSITSTVLPASTSRCRTSSSFSMSAKCSPVVGSSSM